MSALKKLASKPWYVSYELLTGHVADQVTHKWKKCEWERDKKITTSVFEAKYKWLLSVRDEIRVPAECLASACRGRAAYLRVIFTQSFATYNKTIVEKMIWVIHY